MKERKIKVLDGEHNERFKKGQGNICNLYMR